MLTRPPAPKPRTRAKAPAKGRLRIRPAWSNRPWLRAALLWGGISCGVGLIIAAYFWVSYAHLIDRKLGGEERPGPRVFGRPFELYPGEPLTPALLVQRLNDIGYAERPKVEHAGEFSVAPGVVVLMPRPADGRDEAGTPLTVRVEFGRGAVARLMPMGAKRGALDHVTLEAPLLASIGPEKGEKSRHVALASIPQHVIHAVLAIEDHRFFEHPGVDPIRAVGALITNLRGDKTYLVGGSTLTQQIVKNTFLTPEKTLGRKLQEQFMALVLESRFTKNQILELYLNDVVLGQRGPFEIHGVGEAAHLFFAKDVSNLSLAEAATIAGVIQQPSGYSPFRNPTRALDRRNLVLREMVKAGFVTKDEADKAIKMPLGVSARAIENEAPFFVDYLSQVVDEQYENLLKRGIPVDVYTTLDLNLQRLAQEAVADGIAEVDKLIAARKQKGQAEVALLAVDPRTGDILAFVGGRSYSVSQYDRVVAARRQPGSGFKPFVYLAAFERMAAEGRDDMTPATVVVDEPTTFKDHENDYTPANYQNEYAGPVTLRDALAHSRNIVAIKVAEATGYDEVADLWQRVGVGTPAKPYPSIALGVFEASPLEMATAYTIFTNKGAVRPLHAIARIVEAGKPRPLAPAAAPKKVAREDTTFLVTNMMRSVLDSGTAAAARAMGFSLDAAGKTGTTNDLRDAWFTGFTPELLTVVWVGFDNNQPIGLSGAQAALPIWTNFMKRALAGRPNQAFEIPDGITFADIDRENGKLARPECPDVLREAFLAGTEPKQLCDVHGRSGLKGALGALARRLGIIK
jgi:penicillin-binding protein 1B